MCWDNHGPPNFVIHLLILGDASASAPIVGTEMGHRT